MANLGSDLPELPDGFEVVWVDFPPNPNLHLPRGYVLDKGRRILSGILKTKVKGYMMFVDDDDLVSSHLTSFLISHPNNNGWYFPKGYEWTESSKVFYLARDFHLKCGTSHIINSELLNLPKDLESASESYLKRFLGEHINYRKDLKAAGTPLEPLPFIGAVYRIGHAESSWGTSTVFNKYFWKRENLLNPILLAYRMTRIRLRSRRINRDFFGGIDG